MSPIPDTWIPHRRADGELVGWIDMTVAEPLLVPVDRLGRPRPAVEHWDEAESVLDELGLAILTGRFEWTDSDRVSVVRIAQVYEDRIVLTTALTDAVEEVGRRIVVPFPAPEALRPAGHGAA